MTPRHLEHGRHAERGIALIAAVLVVLLSTVLVASFMATSSGERSISSNVQTAKASLYAADAGVRAQSQWIANLSTVKLDSCVTAWTAAGGGNQLVITNPQNLFPAGNFPAMTSTNPRFTASASVALQDTNVTPGQQAYVYLFTVQSTGTVGNAGLRRVQSTGLLTVSASRGSFTNYLMFTNHHTTSSGGAVWFTSNTRFDGRVHTNDEFRFAFQPRFQDLVTSVDSRAWYNNNGHNVELDAPNNGSTDQPIFGGGFNRGVANVDMPTNSFSQQAASLGLSPTMTTAPTNAQVNTATSGQSGSGTSTPANGVYLIAAGGSMTGGIYIKGNTTDMKVYCDSLTNKQFWRIRQSSSIDKTIMYDPTLNVTYIKNTSSGTWAASYPGHPNGMVYATGTIDGLTGPDRSAGSPVAALAEGTQMLIAAGGDIIVEGDLTDENYAGKTNVLGLFSSGGSIRIGTSAPDDLYLDAYVMATGSSGQFTVDNFTAGSPRGSVHLRGGMVTQYYGGFGQFNASTGSPLHGYDRDFHYDNRGLKPPFYPETNLFTKNAPIATTLSWKEI